MPVTQLAPSALPGRRYGSFSGKTASSGAGPHPVDILTQLVPTATPGRRYGSFAGKSASGGGAGPHPVGVLTQLAPGAFPGGRYGSFAGRVEVVVEPPTPEVEPTPSFPTPSGRFRRDVGLHWIDALDEEEITLVLAVLRHLDYI